MKSFIAMIIAAVVLCGCAPSLTVCEQISSIDRLRDELGAKFEDPNFFNANWGVVIQSLQTAEVIYQRNEQKSFMPASNMKLFTTFAALTSLTPDFRYTTTLIANGSIKGGVLDGDLILKGSGDPTISGRYNGGKVTETFEQWADSAKAKGIKEIQGNLVGDRALCGSANIYAVGEGHNAFAGC